jgi:hypothetical protein
VFTIFGGGVYKTFVVSGARDYHIRIARNYSFNTIVSGVFIDKIAGPASKYDTMPMWYMADRQLPRPVVPDSERLALSSSNPLVAALWSQTDVPPTDTNKALYIRSARIIAYRALPATLVNFKAWGRFKAGLRMQSERESMYEFLKRVAEVQLAGRAAKFVPPPISPELQAEMERRIREADKKDRTNRNR